MNKKSLLLLPLIALSTCRYRSGGSRGTHGQQYVVKKEDKGSQITRDEALALLEDIDKNWCDGFDNYQKVSMYARNEESYFTSNIEIGFDLKEDDQYGYRTYVQSFDYNKQKCKKEETNFCFISEEGNIYTEYYEESPYYKNENEYVKGDKIEKNYYVLDDDRYESKVYLMDSTIESGIDIMAVMMDGSLNFKAPEGESSFTLTYYSKGKGCLYYTLEYPKLNGFMEFLIIDYIPIYAFSTANNQGEKSIQEFVIKLNECEHIIPDISDYTLCY